VTDPIEAEPETTLFTRDWDVPWHAHIVPLVLALFMAAVWWTSTDPAMSSWALSWSSLQGHHYLPLVGHIFAHGGWLHLVLNETVLLVLSGPLISRLGTPPIAWLRYLYLFLGSGLSGALLFLLVHRGDTASVLGASGAIFGLVAALARVNPVTGDAEPIKSPRTWLLIKFFLQNHLALAVLIIAMALFSGSLVGFAWEAHLGGLLFGFLATPLYLNRRPVSGR
jgi:membrane associated rhomboid family serine protease